MEYVFPIVIESSLADAAGSIKCPRRRITWHWPVTWIKAIGSYQGRSSAEQLVPEESEPGLPAHRAGIR